MSNDHNYPFERGDRRDRNDHGQHEHDENIVVVNVEDDDQSELKTWIQELITRQTEQIINHIEKVARDMTLNLESLKASVANETTVSQSIVALVDGINQQLKDIVASGTLDTAELQSVIDQIDQNSADLSAAVTRNTPSAETPPDQTPPAEGTPVEGTPVDGGVAGQVDADGNPIPPGDAAPV